MAIALTNLFTGLGKFYKCLYDMHGSAGSTLPTDITALGSSQGATYPDLVGPVLSSESTFQAGIQTNLANAIIAAMQAYLLRVVNADAPQPDATNTPLALGELYRQMISQSYKVSSMTLGGTPTASSTNTGNGAVVIGLKRGDGRPQDNLLVEVAQLVCTADNQHNPSVVAGNEPFTYSGDQAPANALGFDYPGPSGASQIMSVIDSTTATLNLLTNSDFETFTVSNTPDNWPIGSGTAGTDIFKESSLVYRGTAALKFLGTGSNRPIIRQTITTLTPNTVYGVNLWVRSSGTLTSSGDIKITLVDGSNTTITDDQGGTNGVDIKLNTLTTSYLAYGGTIITPKSLPSTVKVQIEASNGANMVNAEAAYLDSLAMAPATFLYPGGPNLSIFAGSAPFQAGDFFSVAMTNNQNSASYGATIQRVFDRVFSTRLLDFLLPTTGSTLINDSLFH